MNEENQSSVKNAEMLILNEFLYKLVLFCDIVKIKIFNLEFDKSVFIKELKSDE